MEQIERKPKISKKDLLIIVLGLTAIIIALIFAIDVLRNKNRPTPPNSTKTASTSAQPYCSDGTVYENKKQGYKLCLAVNETATELSSGTNVKINLKQATSSAQKVPQVHITTFIGATNGGIEFNTTNFKEEDIKIDTISTSKKTYDTPNKAGFRTEIVTFTKFKRVYEVSLETEQEIFAGNSSLVDNLLKTWRFIAETADPPLSDSGNLLVNSPWPGDTIANPVTIEGQGKVFEAVINIRIKDEAGSVLANLTANTAAGSVMSPFNKSVNYQKPSTKNGTIEVFSISPKDGQEINKVIIPVTFK